MLRDPLVANGWGRLGGWPRRRARDRRSIFLDRTHGWPRKMLLLYIVVRTRWFALSIKWYYALFYRDNGTIGFLHRTLTAAHGFGQGRSQSSTGDTFDDRCLQPSPYKIEKMTFSRTKFTKRRIKG